MPNAKILAASAAVALVLAGPASAMVYTPTPTNLVTDCGSDPRLPANVCYGFYFQFKIPVTTLHPGDEVIVDFASPFLIAGGAGGPFAIFPAPTYNQVTAPGKAYAILSVIPVFNYKYIDTIKSGPQYFNIFDLTSFGYDVFFDGAGVTPNALAKLTATVGGDHTYWAVLQGAPEPGVWAMILLGLGALGIVLRRRKSTTTTAA